MADLVPLENLLVTAELSGKTGTNRAAGRRQIDADDDRAAILAWLARYADSPATLAAYRKEVERLMLWCVLQRGRALSDLSHEDLLVYQRFLTDPQPRERWIMAAGQRPGRQSPSWRPFAGPLAPRSQAQAMSVLNGMFNWLVEAGYLAGNPLALRRRTRVTRAAQITRLLPREHWEEVKAAIQCMPRSTPREAARADRARWVFSLLYVAGVRASELAALSMTSFYARSGSDGRSRWWLEIFGKGSKTRQVPVTDELLAELSHYRRSRGLSPLPRAGEAYPAVLPLIGESTESISRQTVHEIVKEVVRLAAARLRARGREHEAAAMHLESASTHWMRHTAGSHLSDRLDIKSVRDHLGHENLATTSAYVHTEADVRHDATNQVHRVGWSSPSR